jgi:hypothetical protein
VGDTLTEGGREGGRREEGREVEKDGGGRASLFYWERKTYPHVCVREYASLSTHIHAYRGLGGACWRYAHAHTHARTHTHTHEHTHVRIHTYLAISGVSWRNEGVHARDVASVTGRQTYVHTHTHTHTHKREGGRGKEGGRGRRKRKEEEGKRKRAEPGAVGLGFRLCVGFMGLGNRKRAGPGAGGARPVCPKRAEAEEASYSPGPYM